MIFESISCNREEVIYSIPFYVVRIIVMISKVVIDSYGMSS